MDASQLNACVHCVIQPPLWKWWWTLIISAARLLSAWTVWHSELLSRFLALVSDASLQRKLVADAALIDGPWQAAVCAGGSAKPAHAFVQLLEPVRGWPASLVRRTSQVTSLELRLDEPPERGLATVRSITIAPQHDSPVNHSTSNWITLPLAHGGMSCGGHEWAFEFSSQVPDASLPSFAVLLGVAMSPVPVASRGLDRSMYACAVSNSGVGPLPVGRDFLAPSASPQIESPRLESLSLAATDTVNDQTHGEGFAARTATVSGSATRPTPSLTAPSCTVTPNATQCLSRSPQGTVSASPLAGPVFKIGDTVKLRLLLKHSLPGTATLEYAVNSDTAFTTAGHFDAKDSVRCGFHPHGTFESRLTLMPKFPLPSLTPPSSACREQLFPAVAVRTSLEGQVTVRLVSDASFNPLAL